MSDITAAELETRYGDGAGKFIANAQRAGAAMGLTTKATIDAYQDRNHETGYGMVESLARAGDAMKRQGFKTQSEAKAELARLKSDPEALAAFGNAWHPKHREVHQRHQDALNVAYPPTGT